MKFFDTILDTLKDPKTYKEIAYLLLTMPLGIGYFIILTTGFSLGAGLAIIGVGILIIAAMMAFGILGGWIESLLAQKLLDADVNTDLDLRYDDSQPFLSNVGRILTNGKAIRSLLFLGLKFPLGIITFVVTILALILPIAFIASPFSTNISVGNNFLDTSPFWSMISMIIGIVMLPIALATLKGMAHIWRKLAEAMLQSDISAEKPKRKQKREVSHLMDDYLIDDEYDDYDTGYDQDAETEELVLGLRQLLDR